MKVIVSMVHSQVNVFSSLNVSSTKFPESAQTILLPFKKFKFVQWQILAYKLGHVEMLYY
jgi:hypothetical protein